MSTFLVGIIFLNNNEWLKTGSLHKNSKIIGILPLFIHKNTFSCYRCQNIVFQKSGMFQKRQKQKLKNNEQLTEEKGMVIVNTHGIKLKSTLMKFVINISKICI